MQAIGMKQLFKHALSCAGATSVLAAPAAAAPLQPTKRWVIEFADEKCVAAREYGAADTPVAIILKPSPIGDILQMTLISPAAGRPTRQVTANVRIGDDPSIPLQALAFDSKQSKVRSVRINLPENVAARLAGATAISVSSEGEVNANYALTQMNDVAKTLSKCVADLRAFWNIGPEHEPNIRARAKANLASFISDEDYPEMAYERDQGGTVKFALLINEAGRVADCTVTESSNVPSLDAQSCAILVRRARFEPAVDTAGKPTKDAVVSRITWRMQ